MGTKIYGPIYGRKGWDALKSGNVWHDVSVADANDNYGLLTVNANANGIITQDNPMPVTGGASSVTATYTSPSDFTATYTSSTTITISALSGFSVTDSSQIVYIKVIPLTGDSEIYVNGSSGVTLKIASNVITISGAGTPFTSGDVYEVGINALPYEKDPSTQSIKVSPLVNVWNQYTDAESLASDHAITDTFTDLGSEIDMRGYNQLGIWMGITIGTSTDVQLRLLHKHEFGGLAEYREINYVASGSNINLMNLIDYQLGTDASQLFKMNVPLHGTTPYIQLQVKDAADGTGVVDTVYITKSWSD
jgi:hypothetical protein